MSTTDTDRDEREGGRCRRCGALASWRECDECDAAAWIIDCGCRQQPRPIAVDETGCDMLCDDCSECRAGACQ